MIAKKIFLKKLRKILEIQNLCVTLQGFSALLKPKQSERAH